MSKFILVNEKMRFTPALGQSASVSNNMMNTIYKRNTVYTFFVGMFLVIPTIVIFLSEQYLNGMIFLLVIVILITHHFGINYDESENEFCVYSGWLFLNVTKKKIKLKSITGFHKTSETVKQSYSLPVSSYSTSIKTFNLEIELDNATRMIMVTGTEKSIDRIIELIKKNK